MEIKEVDREDDVQSSGIGGQWVGYIAKWDLKDYENVSYLFHRIRMANLLKDRKMNMLLLDYLYQGLHSRWNDHRHLDCCSNIHGTTLYQF